MKLSAFSCLRFSEKYTTHNLNQDGKVSFVANRNHSERELISVFIHRGDNGGFSEDQINMYKECFKLMDMDKDGTINKSDLRAAFDNVGKLMDESELDDMLSEVGGACTFDGMIKMFQEKMAGGKLS